MLYISTKNKKQTYTAHQALLFEADIDGGVIAPIRLPVFTKTELSDIFGRGLCGATVCILNKFFSKSLADKHIKDAFGFNVPVSDMLDRKTLLIRLDGCLQEAEKMIYSQLSGECKAPTLWASCAIRIGLLFGVFSELYRCGIHFADFAVESNNVLSFVPVYYGKIMGLPVSKIITGTNNEDAIWRFLHKEQSSDGEQNAYFLHGIDCCMNGSDKIVSEIFSSVVSLDRAKEIIMTMQTTYQKVIDLSAAVSYGALQDYRAITGENRTTVIFNSL